MIAKGSVEIGIETRFGPNWPGERCGARTKTGGACQRPAALRTLSSLHFQVPVAPPILVVPQLGRVLRNLSFESFSLFFRSRTADLRL